MRHDIPFLTDSQVRDLDAYLNGIKPWFPLSREDHHAWKLYKKAMPILNKFINSQVSASDAWWAGIALASLSESGISDELAGEMLVAALKD